MIHEGTGGETEGDTVAPSSSLEDAGGSRVSVFLLDGSFWWLSSYGIANSKGAERFFAFTSLIVISLFVVCLVLPL